MVCLLTIVLSRTTLNQRSTPCWHDVGEILKQVEGSTEASWSALMEPMEEVDQLFEYGWSPVGHLLSVANSDPLREAHDAAMPKIVEFSLQLRQSEAIYRKLVALRDSDTVVGIQQRQQRIITRMIQSAEQSGISLTGKDRERFNEIEQELTQLSTDFSNNLLDATRAFIWISLILPTRRVFRPAFDASRLPRGTRADENKDKPRRDC